MKVLFNCLQFLTIFLMISPPFQSCADEGPSSISDTDQYKDFCLKAATDDETFSNFKQHPGYKQILEHLSYKQGKKHLKYIKDHYPYLLAYWDKFSENDTLGNPVTFKFKKIGYASPTTIRYVKVLGDLEKHFGSLDGKSVIEIGGGYGGQCKIINDRFALKRYAIVDLEGPLKLTERYLSELKVSEKTSINYIVPSETTADTFDICISNYAFSECDKVYQDDYLEKYLLKSSAGYMLYNRLRTNSVSIYTVEEVKDILIRNGYQVSITREDPLTSPRNQLIIWSK